MTEKRFIALDEGYDFIIRDTITHNDLCDGESIIDVLNDYEKENEQLKQSVNNLKETILKITIAYQRKHDNTIVNLVDEVHEEDITDLIKELKE